MGGWVHGQFKENRLPTLAELNAAAPTNPVLVFKSFFGPRLPTSWGRNFLIGKGVTPDAPAISRRRVPIAALNVLRAYSDLCDKKQGMLDAMAYSASVGVTTNVDMGGFSFRTLPIPMFRQFDTSG